MDENIIKIIFVAPIAVPTWAVFYDEYDGIYFAPAMALVAIKHPDDDYEYLHFVIFEPEGGISQTYEFPEDMFGFLGWTYREKELNPYCWENEIRDFLLAEAKREKKRAN